MPLVDSSMDTLLHTSPNGIAEYPNPQACIERLVEAAADRISNKRRMR
jgi:hypothetical protein